MLITHIVLENIKSYRKATIALAPGTTAIRGHNGAGKSTLVEAIGFALFDSLPYARALFLREGEKSGRVVIGLISAVDGRAYEVERRCVASGGGSWFIVDRELKMQPATGKEDVLAFLRIHLGLETTLALADLYESTIAVPQGTFTADFLQPTSLRRKKFDALLQVDDYRKASDELRETERYLRERLAEIGTGIARLETQVAELEPWRFERGQIREQQLAIGERIAMITLDRAAAERARAEQAARQAEVTRRDQERERHYGRWQTALGQATAADALAQRAAAAAAICARSRAGHARYLAAQTALAQSQEAARQAGTLRVQLTREEQILAAAQQALAHATQRLQQSEEASVEVDRLAPLVARQDDLERAARAAEEAQRSAAKLERDHARLAQERAQSQADLATAQRAIADLEPLLPIAALFSDRSQAYDLLKQRETTAQGQRQRHTALIATHERLGRTLELARQSLAAAEVRVTEAQRARDACGPLPGLIAQVQMLDQTIARLKAERQQSERALHASQGGNCPFLKERCLNIERHGLASLEDYFGDEVARRVDEILPLEEERATVWAEHQRLNSGKSLADHLPDLVQSAATARQQVTAQEVEHAATAQEIALLREALAEAQGLTVELQQAKAAKDEAFLADRKCAALTAQRSAQTNAQERLDRIRAQDVALLEEITQVQALAATLAATQAARRELGNPREQSAKLTALAAMASQIQAEIDQHSATMTNTATAISALQVELAPFADIDQRIAAQQAELAATAADHDDYLRHASEAARLPEATAQASAARAVAEAAARDHEAAAAAHAAAHAAFDPQALSAAQEHLTALDGEVATLTERLTQARDRLAILDGQIAEGEARARELAAERAEHAEVVATQGLLSYARDTIKEAGPFVTRALLRQISGEANRIFGEILGDRSARLEWTEEYDIAIHAGGYTRTFAQLSGGEQMSAALALRLALLRTLTRSSLAIFDEPTQNMDGERRANLAEQIRRVRGFEQLLVISHDDTFEEGLDAVIAVHKSGGESQINGDHTLPLLVPALPMGALLGA